jgi:hypothetical protein
MALLDPAASCVAGDVLEEARRIEDLTPVDVVRFSVAARSRTICSRSIASALACTVDLEASNLPGPRSRLRKLASAGAPRLSRGSSGEIACAYPSGTGCAGSRGVRTKAILVAMAAIVGCSSATEGLREADGSDASSTDGEGRADHELAVDAGMMPPDAGMIPLDAGMIPLDAALPDVGEAPDASCGNVGRACSASTPCGPDLECNFTAGPGGVCLPSGRPMCGGFANAQCPSSAPRCMIFNNADFGPCLTDLEQGCVCTSSAGSSRFACGV